MLTESPRQEAATLRPRLEFAAKAFIATAFAGAVVAGTLRLSERAFPAREFRVDLARWRVLARPAWSTLDDVRAVRDAAGLDHYYTSVFDTPAVASLDDYLGRAPTVRRVADVRRVYPNEIEAVLELRRPAVAVKVGTKWVEADEDGVALSSPLPERPLRGGFRLRAVVGAADAAPAPAPGGRFGPDVVAAASLAEALDAYSDDAGRALLAGLDRIDVSNYGGRTKPGACEVTLGALPPVVAPGTAAAPPVPGAVSPKCVVEWGRAGDREAAGLEQPFDAKASRLLEALRLFPGLDGLKTVRVAFDDLAVVADGKNEPLLLKRALEIDGGVQAK